MLIKHYLFPLIKRQKALFFAMALMSALSFSMFVGLSYANNNYQISLDNYFKDYNYPSAVITTDLTTENTFADLKDVVGLQDYDVRFSSLFNINVNGEYINIVLTADRNYVSVIKTVMISILSNLSKNKKSNLKKWK